MKKFSKILFVVIIAVVIFFIGRNTSKNNVNIDNTKNIISNTVAQKDKNSLESYIKKAIIEIVNEKLYKDVTDKTEKVLAEGHKTLKTEEKDGKIYVYVVAEYGVYELKNDEIMPVSASASPITIVLDSSDYRMIGYSLPSDNGDEAWMASLKEMFPEELIFEVTSVDYKEEFYQEQIKKYFDDTNAIEKQDSEKVDNAKQMLLDVMNSKHKFIDENNKNVYFKDFEIVEGQTAEVETYAFVDMDDDGIEELIIYTTSDYGAYVILHYENQEVYGYMIGIRSLENLKSDGTFIGSNGAHSNEYLRMKFNKNEYSIETEAVYDKIDKIYKISDTDVSEKEIKDYTEKWSKKEDVSWSK